MKLMFVSLALFSVAGFAVDPIQPREGALVFDAINTREAAAGKKVDFRGQVASEKALLASLEVLYQQARALYSRQAISEEDFRAARAKVEVSRAHVVELEATARDYEWQEKIETELMKAIARVNVDMKEQAKRYVALWEARVETAEAALRRSRAQYDYDLYVYTSTARLEHVAASSLQKLIEATAKERESASEVEKWRKLLEGARCVRQHYVKAVESEGRITSDFLKPIECPQAGG